MKKLLLILAMLVLVIGLVGCGKEEAAPEAPSTPAMDDTPAEAPMDGPEMMDEPEASPEVEEEVAIQTELRDFMFQLGAQPNEG